MNVVRRPSASVTAWLRTALFRCRGCVRKERKLSASYPLSAMVCLLASTDASKGSAPLISATFPPVSRKARGRPSSSTMAWILVVRPPRDRPMAWSWNPLFGAARRTMRLHRRTVDHGERGRIGAFDESGEQTLPHSPRWLQRLYRLNTVVYGPYSSGSARHRQPSRNRWTIPLMMRRSSCRSGPVWTIGRPARAPRTVRPSAKNCPPRLKPSIQT